MHLIIDRMTVADVTAQLLNACKANDAAFIDGALINLDKAPSVLLDFAAFCAAVAAEKPDAVFSSQLVFDVDEWLESELEAAGWGVDQADGQDGHVPTLQQAKAHLEPQLALLEQHSGTPYFMSALYTKDGMVRRMSHQAAWYTDISNVVDDMLEQRLEAVQLTHSRADDSHLELIAELIEEIAAREDFQATKGLPKRALLVQALYGDKIPKHPKGLVTRLKQHLDLMDVNFAHVLKTADEKTWSLKLVKR